MDQKFSDINDVIRHFTELEASDGESFNTAAELVEQYQRSRCPVYARYDGYPYLPVEAFKLATVTTFPPEKAERVFVSSGTASQQRSRHHVLDTSVYERSVLAGFDLAVARRFSWKPGDVRILGHLPAYAEESSLVAMLSFLIEHRGAPGSQLFLEDVSVLEQATDAVSDQPVLLFGAAFGLLDLLQDRRWALPEGSVVIETGGMKTHRREIGRTDLHARLAEGFGLPRGHILSEYGMCELMSQCYTDEHGLFRTPPWMRFQVLDPDDGTTPLPDGEEGVLALIDLANIHTVSRILTEDRATARDGGFQVHGRLAASELRGCNFLVESK